MKKLLLLIAFTSIISCKPKVKKAVDYAIVSGKIENTDAKKITFYSQFDRSKSIEINITEDGSFKDTLRMPAKFYTLRENNNFIELYTPKGADLKIEYNSKKKDSTIQFLGSESIINRYLLDKSKNIDSISIDQDKLYIKDEEDFKASILKIKTSKENLLAKTKGISKEFKKNELKNINYNYLYYLNRYPSYYAHYSKNKDFKASENLLDELKNLDLDNVNDFIFSTSYRALVRSKYKELVASEFNTKTNKDSIPFDILYLKTLAKIKNTKIKNKLLFDDAKYGITYTNHLEEYFSLFSANSTNEENNKTIIASYNKLKVLAKGKPSPKFIDYENNTGGTTSLDDLKGKYLYLDIWATWCAPCIAEIPSLKKLEKEYHDKNIEFISISIDKVKDHEKWKKMIIDKELKGIQLFADNNWESQFIEEYLIKGIPRFILIDPNGNIVNANAPRPSSKKLVTTLKSLNL
ncbi:MAG: TlpA disulfide reductase family protein [Polaribacter sp.]|uniref:TlpA family protein disulfide reductase n=1 Tax=Polaribacter sp. TaxID=1920175 RepID=UPI00326348B2